MDLTLPRGVDDIEPERHARQEKVRSAFEEVARLYNFKLMEPASLEHLATLRAKSGEGIDSEIYTFKDKAGRDIGLRFDLTVGITRYVCSRKDLKLPAKLGASGGCWRYDEPQHGRYRWFHQWDLEIFGPPSVEADAEVIDASAAMLRKLGADFTVEVGDRRVVEDYIRGPLGVADDGRLVELMRALDKVEKKDPKALRAEYEAKGFGGEQVDRLLDFGRLRGRPDEILARAGELRLGSVKDLTALADILDSRGLRNVEYNMRIVRGIDYYTGIVFEAADNKDPHLGSLFGGGRYDALPKIFGRPDLSATGAAGGIERIAMSIASGAQAPTPVVYVAVAGKANLGAQKVAGTLRGAGIPCELPLQPRSLSSQLEEASKAGASWTVIVGEKEVKASAVTLRDMRSRKEELLPLQQAIDRISRG